MKIQRDDNGRIIRPRPQYETEKARSLEETREQDAELIPGDCWVVATDRHGFRRRKAQLRFKRKANSRYVWEDLTVPPLDRYEIFLSANHFKLIMRIPDQCL